MRLKIGLATLISLISITGVAVAATGGIHVFGINLPVAAPASKIGLEGSSEYASVNCWAVTGASNGASCDTSTSGDAPGIPGLPGLPELGLPDLPGVPGLSLPNLPGVPSLPGLPSACGSPVAGLVPAPTSSLKVATDALKGAEGTLKGAISGVTVPQLPVPIPVSVPSIGLDTLTKELGCATTSASPASSAPALCDITVPGAPVALPVPAEASALLGNIANDVKSLTGQSLPAIGGSSVSASCSADAPSTTSVVPNLTIPQPNSLIPTLPKLPNVNNTIGGVTKGVTKLAPSPSSLPIPSVSGTLDTVTGVVTDVLSIVGAPTCSANASGGLVSGVLGSITGSASASC